MNFGNEYSLYDLLNNFSSQQNARGPRDSPRGSPFGGPPGPHMHPHGGPHHGGPHHGGPNFGGPNFGGPRGFPPNRGGPMRGEFPFGRGNFGHPMFSRFASPPPFSPFMDPDAYYYRPAYYYVDDDDDEEDDTEYSKMDQDDEESKPDEGADIRSYYHTRPSRAAPSQDTAGEPQLADFLNAFFGNRQPIEAETKDEVNPILGPEEASKEAEPSKEEPKEELKNLPAEESSLDKEKPEDETKKQDSASKPRPLMKKKSSSFLHKPAHGHAVDPLQVSRPEHRMDLPFSPEINVYNCENSYTVVMGLPGASSKSFKVDFHPTSHELLIKGNIEDKVNIDEEFLKIAELKYGAFERSIKFPLLPHIDDTKIKASYSNGLLQIKVPKILDSAEKPIPKKRIVIEEVPDEELEFEKNPNPEIKI
ncbi:hypothetical protein TBLA_0A04240 [Henningerozyma blattae CBS 6284]|uniref:SHSP domain-containing protein n=1 Tax=Henningerozyma blattae (strain ATCC 34711 / CBS 6284 / DSM 70876 / NBRC 10599 / NRRL Y-10934 / UCD 77-7) TaxID=1071380 RepID=I2GVR7_HENB6|nr:hypothetical protein TBLA_0A04240 [Tetrapisispora blattae CBS 6284]CCH58219.1 hypothetical protein TBLA_0A04240 [Tetrapisispora blattae CBS 6284]